MRSCRPSPCTRWAALAVVLVLSLCIPIANSNYVIDVLPRSYECFFEHVIAGTPIATAFAVQEGGNLDIDVKVYGPDGTLLGHSTDGATDEVVTVKAPMDGTYSICFSNEMSSRTIKTVMFNIDVGEAPESPGSETDEKQRKLKHMIDELAHALTAVQHDQEFMETRQAVHQQVTENTGSKVTYWFAFQSMLMVSMCMFQIYYLKRSFEVKVVV